MQKIVTLLLIFTSLIVEQIKHALTEIPNGKFQVFSSEFHHDQYYIILNLSLDSYIVKFWKRDKRELYCLLR